MKILLIQFRRKQEARKRELNNFKKIFTSFDIDSEIDLLDGINEYPDINHIVKYDRIIMGGSELSFQGENEPDYIRKMSKDMSVKFKDFVFKLVESNTPSLSICFSHQLFGYIFGSSVKRDKCRGKVGSFLVEVKQNYVNDPIFEDMPNKFYANYMHQDVLCASPDNATVLAHGERCKCAVIKYGHNSYTTQFHPELTDIALRNLLEMYPHYARFENKHVDNLIKNVAESHKILKNFIINL